jgi:NADPH2:quinone reductase
MKAILIHEFGGPEVLKYEDAADPTAKHGEVLVRVRAAGVNPADTYARTGTYAVKPTLPYIPGSELAGEIAEGPRRGERIFALGTAGPRLTGACAELAVVKNEDAYRLPDHLSFAQGAAIPIAFGTAWRALFDRGRVQAGQNVLIHGASGGVGTAAVQLASAHGATVIGTASTPEGQKVVRECGAAHVFNHRDANYRDEIKAATDQKGVDLIIEMLANVNLDHDLDLLALGGTIVIIGSRGRIEIDPRKTMGKETNIAGVTLWGGGDAPIRRALAGIVALLARKALTPVVGSEVPLREAARAHKEVMENGSAGKIVLIS